MPPFDREAALKAAEKALKLGKVDAAIAEYVKVVEAQPRDWNSANALGDLYVRAEAAREGRRAVHAHRRSPRGRGLLSKGGGALQEDPQAQARRRIRAAAVGRSRRQAGHAGRRQAVLPAGRRAAQGARRQEGRRRDRDPPRHARSRRSRRAHARRPARRRDGRHGHRAARVPRRRGAASRSRTSTAEALVPLQSAFDLDHSRRRTSAAGCSPPISRRQSRRWRARWRKGAGELKQIAAALEKAGQGRRGARSARRGRRAAIRPTSRCAPAWRWRTSRAAISTRRARYLSAGDRRQQSRAVDDAGRNRAARRPVRRRQGGGRPGADARSEPGAGRGRARLPARRDRIRKPAISRSTRWPMPRSPKATSPRPRSRCTSSPRACARTSSR